MESTLTPEIRAMLNDKGSLNGFKQICKAWDLIKDNSSTSNENNAKYGKDTTVKIVGINDAFFIVYDSCEYNGAIIYLLKMQVNPVNLVIAPEYIIETV